MGSDSGAPGHSSSPEASIGTASNSTSDNNSARQRIPRSLPPWIESYESSDGPITEEKRQLLFPPKRSVLPLHNHEPSEHDRRVSRDGFVDWADDPLLESRGTPPRRLTLHQVLRGARGQQGRKWDHLRTADPVVVAAYSQQNLDQGPAAAWRHFLQSSVYGGAEREESEVVGPEILDELQPTFNEPLDTPLQLQDSRTHRQRRRTTFAQRVWRMILRNPFVPLLFRLTVLITSIASLAVAARIFMHEQGQNSGPTAERTQSIVAIVIDVVAVPYIGYMLWDEYTGKPLGLRKATQKIALILLDLFFIIFKSASTALAFESLVHHNRSEAAVKHLSSALAAFMFVGILAWTMNFMVNIFRTVARLGPGDEATHRRA